MDAENSELRFAPRVIGVHFHDNHGEQDEHLLPFEGVIDWAGVMQGLWDGGYRGRITYENVGGTFADLAPVSARLRLLWPGNTGENQS